MAETAPSGAASDEFPRAGATGARHGSHPFIDLRRPFRGRLPDSSVGGVRKVAKVDSRTHIVAAREPGGRWFRLLHRMRFTRTTARVLREAGISEVVLRRGFSRASFPLAWMSQRSE